jgi:serine/threonine-protein kinase
MAAKLSHPNIVPIYRADEVDGVAFFVMGYVDGPSLGEQLAAQRSLAPATVARVLRDVALALDYAHSRGVIHRDIKPENILVEEGTGRPLVTDFGIARLAEAAPLTQTGQVLGTVHYMSPEQVSGDPIDGRSDLYSLGVVGFRALTGGYPFDHASASAVLVSHVTKAPPRVRDAAASVPLPLATVIDRCLRKDPAARYLSGAALAAAFDEAMHAMGSDPAALVPAATTASQVAAAPESPTAPVPPVLSAREAEAIWERAATLQAETGLHPQAPRRQAASPVSSMSTDPNDRRSLTTGYRFSDVRAAAEEAGIPTRYVARAAEELGIAPSGTGGTAAVTRGVEDRSTPPNLWVGSSTGISFEIVVPREATADDFESLLEIIQRDLRDSGHVSTLARSLRWSSTADRRQLQINAIVRGGQTTIRAEERLRPLVGGIFGGLMGGLGGGSSGIAMAIGTNAFHSIGAGFGLWGATVSGAFVLARTIFKRSRGKRERELRALVEKLAAQLGGSASDVKR